MTDINTAEERAWWTFAPRPEVERVNAYLDALDAYRHAIAATARDRAFEWSFILCALSVLRDLLPLLAGHVDQPEWERLHAEVRRICDAPLARDVAA